MADDRAGGDAFEAIDMHDGARVVHRDKQVSRLMAALLAVPGFFTMALGAWIGIMNATASKPVPAAALPFVVGAVVLLGAMLVLLGVAFGVLRVVVTEKAVHVRYGAWGPTIPLAAIRSCRVVPYDAMAFGGWGIKRGRGGVWAYVAPETSDVVEVVYADEAGAERKVLFGAERPGEVARQVNEARGGARRRIAEDAGADAEAQAEEEANAEEEAARGRSGAERAPSARRR